MNLAQRFRTLADDSPGDEQIDSLSLLLPRLAGDSETGVVVELGAGTGRTTRLLARHVGTGEIHAVEADADRAAELRPQELPGVVVHEADLFSVELPPTWDLVLAHHLVCQLSPEQRAALFELLAARLAPGGVAILDRHDGGESGSEQTEHLSSVLVDGEESIERWFSRTADGDQLRFRNRFVLMRDGEAVDEEVHEGSMWACAEDRAVAEWTAAGLAHEFVDDRLVLLRASARPTP